MFRLEFIRRSSLLSGCLVLYALAGCLVVLMGLLAAPPAEAQTVTTTISDPCPFCGISSSGMVLDPGTDQILVAGGGSNSYVWVDGTNNTSYQSYIFNGASTNGGVAVNPVTHKFYELISISGYAPRLLVYNSSTGNLQQCHGQRRKLQLPGRQS